MKVSVDYIKKVLKSLNYYPENGSNETYVKNYSCCDDYTIKINFEKQSIEYRSNKIDENEGIHVGDNTTSNFENSENFVVLECIDRLLEKGYNPKNISLEHKYPLGRELKGKMDILVLNDNGDAFLMIECKTWGSEYTKEQKKMIKDGGQLFSYYIQDKSAKYLCLYTSKFNNKNIDYCNSIIKVDEAWLELNNKKEIHDHWNKNFNDNGIFDEWAEPYAIEMKTLTSGRLKELTQEDSGRIFNQFAEILRHNVISDKPNAFNKILNLFICKIYDENKNDDEEVEFQWRSDDTDEKLQNRLNDLYKKGMLEFLEIDVTDFSEDEISIKLSNIEDQTVLDEIKKMFSRLRLQKNAEFAFIEVYNDQSFISNARVVREVVELLQPYRFRYGHKQQFLGDFFELLLNTSIKQESGQFFTPVPITRFIISCLPIKEIILSRFDNNETQVLPTAIDYATGSGHFLTEYMDQVQKIIEKLDISKAKPSAKNHINIWRSSFGKFEWAKDYVYGIEADYRLVKTTKVSSFLNGDGEANIIRANGLDHFGKSKDFRLKLKEISKDDSRDNGQFDILIANPPYSVASFKSTVKYGDESFELFNKLTDSSSEIECLFIERAKQLLCPGGVAGIILPSSILSNTGIYTLTREIILKYFRIIAITEFGSNTFMATGTNTVTLFLERRANGEWESIYNAIKSFFDRPKDFTVFGIEKAFSKYVHFVFQSLSLEDYITLILKKPNEHVKNHELYIDYIEWFNKLSEVKQMKDKKNYKDMTLIEQNKQMEELFFEKIFEIEKQRILYFLLTYNNKTVVVKVGEKEEEKKFIGYEFSNRRGHEGIKMLSSGTSLYSGDGVLNPEKVNTYIYKAFINEEIDIDESLKKNIFVLDTVDMLDINKSIFEKSINTKAKRSFYNVKYNVMKLENICNEIINGNTPLKSVERYWNSNDVPWLTISDIDENKLYLNSTSKYVSRLALEDNKVKVVPANSVLISCTATVGRVCVNSIPLTTNQQINAIICNKSIVVPDYVAYFLKTYAYRLLDNTSNSGVSHINLPTLKNFQIVVPPIDVQTQIVNEFQNLYYLEKNNNKRIEELEKEISSAEYFNYPEVKLGKVSIMIKRGKSAKYGDSHVQVIKSGQARGYQNFDLSKKYYASDDFISDERNLIKDDILVNSTGVGTAGRITLFNLEGDFIVDSHITIVRLDKSKVNPKYVLYALANIGFKNIEKMATGQSGQVELSLSTINNIMIPLPSVEIQDQIVSKIEKIEKEIEKLKIEVNITKKQQEQVLIKYLND